MNEDSKSMFLRRFGDFAWGRDVVTVHGPVPLPDEIVRRYNGSGMAIVGWEIDQVRRTPKGDVSVPISAS